MRPRPASILASGLVALVAPAALAGAAPGGALVSAGGVTLMERAAARLAAFRRGHP